MFKKNNINKVVSQTLVVMLFACGLLLPLGCLASEGEVSQESQENSLSQLYDYELFKAVMKIHGLVGEAKIEARKYGISTGNYKKKFPDANPFCNSTKKGLRLWGSGHELCTPWGLVYLHSNLSFRFGSLIFHQIFSKRVKTSFIGILSSKDNDLTNQYYVLNPNDIDLKTVLSQNEVQVRNLFVEISKEELNSKKGQNIIVNSSLAGCKDTYAVHEIDGYELPELEDFSSERECATPAERQLAWREMQRRFDEEHPVNLQHLSKAALDDNPQRSRFSLLRLFGC